LHGDRLIGRLRRSPPSGTVTALDGQDSRPPCPGVPARDASLIVERSRVTDALMPDDKKSMRRKLRPSSV